MDHTLTSKDKKEITTKIEEVVTEGLDVDIEGDLELLNTTNLDWDELNHLKDELGGKVIEFIMQIQSIIMNEDIVQNLGDHETHFKKVINIFFHDVNEFSKKVAALRTEHEHLSGKVKSLEEMTKYNRVSIQYQYLYSELITLISPTMASIITIANAVVTKLKNDQETNNVE